MKVSISNTSRLSSSPSKITLNNINNVGRTTFSTVAKLGEQQPSKITITNINSVGKVSYGKVYQLPIEQLADLSDVSIVNPQDGQVLVYQSSTNKFITSFLPRIDGGIY
jgi:hypothetical protein